MRPYFLRKMSLGNRNGITVPVLCAFSYNVPAAPSALAAPSSEQPVALYLHAAYEKPPFCCQTLKASLVTLDALALHVHFALGRDDGFDIVGLGQGAQIHIIVHHQEFVLQVRTAEPVALHLLDAGGIHAVAQQ